MHNLKALFHGLLIASSISLYSCTLRLNSGTTLQNKAFC